MGTMEEEIAEHNKNKEDRRKHLQEVAKGNVREANKRKFVKTIMAPFEKIGAKIEAREAKKAENALREERKRAAEQRKQEEIEREKKQTLETYTGKYKDLWMDVVHKGKTGCESRELDDGCVERVVYLKEPGPLVRRDWYKDGKVTTTEVFGAVKDPKGFITFKRTKFNTSEHYAGDYTTIEVYSGYTCEVNPSNNEIDCRRADLYDDRYLAPEVGKLVKKFEEEFQKAQEAEKGQQPGE